MNGSTSIFSNAPCNLNKRKPFCWTAYLKNRLAVKVSQHLKEDQGFSSPNLHSNCAFTNAH
jgi:hypothetical protein